ncbi:hypothetical protein RSOL_513680 [Rhizoctonia solani AG-3 Rhs1AP]|uniref:Uncharacterized protein n=1 Tax=Rhizoctonia solani AG-3 Rhs1AP TaxID=1086054 RepID=X8JMU2_9AGAM|nr:hypothetical protein RSOL_513680 [Rhizoctonia solani AG-3 Rhs1AP]
MQKRLDTMEASLPHTAVGEEHRLNYVRASVSPHPAPRVSNDAKYESTSDELNTAHLFDIAKIDAYNHHLPQTSHIDENINGSTFTVDTGSISVARPIIIREHPAMYAVPMSAVIGVWEGEGRVEPFCHMP